MVGFFFENGRSSTFRHIAYLRPILIYFKGLSATDSAGSVVPVVVAG